MVSLIGDQYGGDGAVRQGEMQPVLGQVLHSYYRYGVQTACTSYPTGYEAIGSSIVGVLLQHYQVPSDSQDSGVSDGADSGLVVTEIGVGAHPTGMMSLAVAQQVSSAEYTYAPSVCATPTDVTTTVREIEFAQDYRIYNDQIFLAGDRPPTLAQVAQPVASCSLISRLASDGTADPTGTATGTDVLITKQNDHLTTRFLQGRYSSGQFVTSKVDPFVSLESRTTSSDTFTAQGFKLVISRNGQKHTTGSLTGVLDGQSLSLNLECWLETP